MDTDTFQTLFERLPIGAYRSSYAGHQLRANAALVALNGYRAEAEMLANIGDIATEWYCDPQRRKQFTQLLSDQGQVVDFVSEVYRHKTRERIWVREHAHQVCDAQGVLRYFEGTVQEITDEYQRQLDLHASEDRFRAMTDLSSDWYWELDVVGRFVRLDIGSRSVNLGLSQEVLGKTRQQLPQIALNASQWVTYQALLDAHEAFYEFEMPIQLDSKRLLWHAISDEPVFNTEGLFMDRLQQALFGMARTGQCAVLMFLDLDRFKALNDQRGHSAGDLLLQQVAQRLTACVRGVDTVARLGGDEFTILMEDVDADDQLAMRHARTAADKVMQALAIDFDLGGDAAAQRYACGVSLGVVILRDPLASADACLNQADAAMYQAKGNGCGGVWIDADARG